MRWHAADLDAIASYAKAEGVDRAEAIRRLVRQALKSRKKRDR
jgi:plasmid stabilization system protein ParE